MTKEIFNHLRHPRQAYRELNIQLDKMMLIILSGGSACEPGMKEPLMIERTPKIEVTSENKEGLG